MIKLYFVCLLVWVIILGVMDLVKQSTTKQKISFLRVLAKATIAGVISACILGGIVYLF